MQSYRYHTLEEIRERKEELRVQLQSSGDDISNLWHKLFVPKKANSKGELVTSLVSNGITAFDAFMMVRKLLKTYGHLFGGKKR